MLSNGYIQGSGDADADAGTNADDDADINAGTNADANVDVDASANADANTGANAGERRCLLPQAQLLAWLL